MKSFLVFLLLAFAVSTAHAQVPRIISYQGEATDGNGKALSGTYHVTFTVYTDSNAGRVFELPDTPIVFVKGVFDAHLTLPGSVKCSSSLWLGVIIEGDSLPQSLVTAVPYALYAPEAGHAKSADSAGKSGNGGMSNPMTQLGDLLYEDATLNPARLPGSTTSTKEFLTQTGTGTGSATPTWSALASADIPTNAANTSGTASNVTGTVAIANGGTGASTTSANFVFAGPGSGASAAPRFRLLVPADIPAGSGSYIQNGTSLQTGATFKIDGAGTLSGFTNNGALTQSGNASFSGINSMVSTGTVQEGLDVDYTYTGTLSEAYAILGHASTSSNNELCGGRFYVTGSGTGSKLGIGGANDASSSLYGVGVYGVSTNTGTGGTGGSFGGMFQVAPSSGAGATIGVYAAAAYSPARSLPTSGNYAAFLDGPTNLNGNTTITGTLTVSGTITATSLSGTASNVTGTVAIANGGTGQTTQQTALDALSGGVTSGAYLRGNGTHVVLSALQAGDVPTLNQNTTGTASNVTGTIAIAHGGTGQTTQQTALNSLAGGSTSGNYLRGNGSNVVLSTIQAADLPSGSGNYVWNFSNVLSPQSANFSISGLGTAGSVQAGTLSGSWNAAIAGQVSSGSGQYAGYFNGGYGLFTQGNQTATGSKAALVPIGSQWRKLYCEEATEIYFSDYGSAKLVAGHCSIHLDSAFLQAVTIDSNSPLKVFISMGGATSGVFVLKRTDGFDVMENNQGASTADFDFRVMAKRRGYENLRFEVSDPPPIAIPSPLPVLHR